MTPDVEGFYANLGILLIDKGRSNAAARCFADKAAHRRDDRNPSCSVSLTTGAWICHGCGARGGAYDAALARGHTPRGAMTLLRAHDLTTPRGPTASTTPPAVRRSRQRATRSPTEAPVTDFTRWIPALTRQHTLLRRLQAERAIDPSTLIHLGVGYDRGRLIIPLHDAAGQPCGAVAWQPFPPAGGRRIKMVAIRGTRRELFPPPETLPGRQLLLCEGEPDALAGLSAGLPAVAIPGVAAWRTEWTERLAGRDVTVIFDCDQPGHAAASRVAHALRHAGISVRVLDLWIGRSDGYDLTDHLLRGRGSHQLPVD